MKYKALIILILVPLIIFMMAIILKDKNMQGQSPYYQVGEEQFRVTNKQAVPPPNKQLDITKSYKVILKTSEGDITIKVYPLDVPMASTNFVYLSKIGYYDGIIFHRVIKDFMIQSGDPKGNGTGGPGYTFNNEPFDEDYKRGVVAMANSGPDTNGSQFFIMHQDYLQLPKDYVIFGKVVGGMEVVDKIAGAPVEDNGMGEISKPVNPVTIVSAEVVVE